MPFIKVKPQTGSSYDIVGRTGYFITAHMFKSILTAAIPPLAVCRYGCINSCALPITSFWIGGLFLLGYFVVSGHAISNELIKYGSLLGGLGLLGIAIMWAQSTIARVGREQCSSGGRGILCKPVSNIATKSQQAPAAEDDPLAEVEKARKL